MKILHVEQCGGGVQRAVDDLTGILDDHEHLLLSADPAAHSPKRGRFSRSWRMVDGHLGRIAQLRRIVREEQPDVVHAHSSWAGFYARATRLPVRVVYEPHGYAFEFGSLLHKAVYFAAEWLLAKRPGKTAVLSPREDFLARRLNAGSPRVLVPNVPTVSPSGPRKPARTVVMIGRICYQKDPSYFARLANLVNEVDPTIQFRWVGDGDAHSKAELQKSGVVVTGWAQDDRLLAELATAGLYAHSARYEGFPLSVLDAAACGVPILARAIPAFDGSPVKQADSPEELAALISQFFGGALEDELLQRGSSLLNDMNAETQRAALRGLYGGEMNHQSGASRSGATS